jgi:hypothetical protein
MFVYHSRFLTRGEVWYDDEPDSARVDWIYHRQRSSPMAKGRWRPFYTPLIDLRQTPTELLAGMDEKTARKITDAQEKDRLRWGRCNAGDTKTLDQVEWMWNEFATATKSPRFERDWVDRMAEAGCLDVSAAQDQTGRVLAYHLVLLTRHRARQLFAISPRRALPDVAWRGAVSRANSFIHWKNFLAFRSQGISWFDFGGWYPGTTDLRFLGINAFKESFGGKIVREFECEQVRTLKGWLVLTVARRLARARIINRFGNGQTGPVPNAKIPSYASAKSCEISPAV